MNSLVAAYGLADMAASSYWLKLEQDGQESDAATIGEAADLLDALYDRDPCEGDPTGGEEPEEDEDGLKEPVDPEEFWEKVQEQLEFSVCDDENGCDTLLLRVYRSHVDEPYKLVFDNGTLAQTSQKTSSAKQAVSINGENYADLNYPVAGNLQYQWSSLSGGLTPPKPVVDGARIKFGRTVTGQIRLQYETEYDLVRVSVPRDEDGKPGSCHVLAMYAGTITEEDLQPAELDDTISATDAEKICGSGGQVIVPDKPYSCYERIYHQILCQCTGKESGKSYTTEQDCSCPDFWGDDISPGRHLVDSRTITSYVACPGEGIISQNDLDEYKARCCVEGTPPPCDTVYGTYQGGKAPNIYALKVIYGPNITLIPVGPKDGVCGKWIKKWEKRNKNCCEDVEPIGINAEATQWEISLPGSATVVGIGGSPPYYWKVSGGYVFANGLDEDVTYSYPPVNTIYTESDDWTCGDATVVLQDDCSTATAEISQVADVVEPRLPTGIVVTPGATVYVELEQASVGPYRWAAGDGISWMYEETAGPANALIVSEDFCGMGNISVSDACTNVDTNKVKSTAGHWEPLVSGVDYDPCSPPESGSYVAESVAQEFLATSASGEYRAQIITSYSNVHTYTDCVLPDMPCDVGNVISDDGWWSQVFCPGWDAGTVPGGNSAGCCEWYAGAGVYISGTQRVTLLWRWECP